MSTTSPDAVGRADKLTALRLLVGAMLEQGRTGMKLPSPTVPLDDPAQLARESAASAVIIANSAASLGLPGQNNTQLAQNLWTESLAQIDRIQKLYGLPAMPFQSQKTPPGPI